MEADEIRLWIDDRKDFYLKLYGLDRWKIDFEVDEDEEADAYGRCTVAPEYEKATVTIYSCYHNDEIELKDTICHELEHILCAPFELFLQTIKPQLPAKTRDLVSDMFYSMGELARNNIGRFRENVLELSASRVSDDPAEQRLCQQPQTAEGGQQAQEEPICTECARRGLKSCVRCWYASIHRHEPLDIEHPIDNSDLSGTVT